MEIHWDNPEALLILWLLVPAAFAIAYRRRRQRRAAERFLQPSMGERLLPTSSRSRTLTRSVLLLGGLSLLVVAIARPRWGVFFDQVTRRGADLMVVLDVSRSMLSEDVKPNRLDRARSDIRDLLQQVKGDRVGLVAFAGKAVPACPLTTDQGFFRLALDQIGPHSVPVGGTAIGDAIRLALDSMEKTAERDQAILLITDGEDHDSFPKEAALAAAERKVKIFAVGLGDTSEGARVPASSDPRQRTYLKHEGQEVWSRMDESLLQDLALSTGGAYIPARTRDYDLGTVYEEHLAALQAGELASETRKRHQERFQLFLALGLVMILLEMMVSPFRRDRAIRVTAGLLLGTALLPATAQAGTEKEAAAEIRAGINHLREGRPQEALDRFESAREALPDEPLVAFDVGVASAAKGDFDAARSAYLQAASARDPELAARAFYNLGAMAAEQAQTLFGERPEEASKDTRSEGVALLEDAIRSYRSCLDVQPAHDEARHNLELLRLWLKHMNNVWAERDKQEEQQELDLLGLLAKLKKEQLELRRRTRAIASQADTPPWRAQLEEMAAAEEGLAEQIPVVKQKLAQQFQQASATAPPGQGGPGATPPTGQTMDPQMAQAMAHFNGLADQASSGMSESARLLRQFSAEEAGPLQQEAHDSLDQIWLAMAPYDQVLNDAIQHEQTVVDDTIPRVEGGEDPAVPADLLELLSRTEDQARVAMIAPLLPQKGEQMLAQMEAMSAAAPGPGGNDSAPPAHPLTPSPKDEGDEPDADSADQDAPLSEEELAAQQMQEQVEGLRTSVEKAKEHAGRIEELATEATQDLAARDFASALPKEEEALRLLQEIAESLPKNDQDQQGQDQNQNQDQDQQDEEQNNENQDSEDSENDENQDQQEEPPQDQEQPQDQDQSEQEQPAQPQPVTPEQIEAMLRKAEEQEREAAEKRRALEALVAPRKVERDW